MLVSDVAFEDHAAILDVRQREHSRFRQLEIGSEWDWRNRFRFNGKQRSIIPTIFVISAFGAALYALWKYQKMDSIPLRAGLAVIAVLLISCAAFQMYGRKPLGDMHPWRMQAIQYVVSVLRVYAELATGEEIQRALGPVLMKKAALIGSEVFDEHVAAYEYSHYTKARFLEDLAAYLMLPAEPQWTVLAEISALAERPTSMPGSEAPFPKRATWLAARLMERGWSSSDPSKYSGPDRKTIEKILRGETVRNDVLEKLASSLSAQKDKINVLEIPGD